MYYNLAEQACEKIEKTLYNLEIGDIIISSKGDYRKILSVLPSSLENRIYILSDCSDEIKEHDYFKRTNEDMSLIFTTFDLEECGYEVYNPEPIKEEVSTELTIAQIEEKLGISNLKIID